MIKPFYFYVVAFLLVSTIANAQVQGWQWAKKTTSNYQLNAGNNPSTSSTDKAGNVYLGTMIADTSFEVDGHSLTTWGKTDMLLSSFSCEGRYRWSKVLGCSSDSDRLISVKTDSLGNVYACGIMTLKSNSGGSANGHLDTDTTIIGNSYRTMFIAKWDSAGQFKWLRMPQPDTIGFVNANLYTALIGMDVSPDGTVHLACYLSPGGYAGYRMRVNSSGVYIIRYAANGDYLSNTSLDMHDPNYDVRSWNKYFLTEFKYDPVHLRYLVYGFNYDYYKVKFISTYPLLSRKGYIASFNAATGSLAFQKIQTYIPNVSDTVLAIQDLALDRSGNIYLTGETDAGAVFNGVKFTNPLSQPSTFIIKMDGNNGDTLWTKIGKRTEKGFKLSPYFATPLGNHLAVSNGVVAVGGRIIDSLNFPGYSVHNNRVADSFDLFMLQLNAATGAINSSTIIPSGLIPVMTSVGTDERGNFYFAGFCADSVRFTNPNNPGSLALYDPNTNPYPFPFWFLAKWGVAGCTCTAPKANYGAGNGTGKTVVYNYTGTTLGIDSLVWDWGDGQSTTVTSGFTTPISHTYATAGKQYEICVNVYGDCGSNQYCGLSAPVSVVNVGTTASGILVYPNPANNYVTLENASGAKVEMYNSLGQNVRSFKVLQARENIDVSRFSKGIYLLQITTAKGAREQVQIVKY